MALVCAKINAKWRREWWKGSNGRAGTEEEEGNDQHKEALGRRPKGKKNVKVARISLTSFGTCGPLGRLSVVIRY